MASVRSMRFIVPIIGLVLGAAAVGGAGAPAVRVGAGAGDRIRPVSTHPAALRAASDCDHLRTYATEAIVETLVENPYWWWVLPWAGGEGDGGSFEDPTDYTTTNVQEAGVDELDVMKTDGSYIYVAMDQALTIFRSWPADATEIVATLPVDGYLKGMFLLGDRALLVSNYWGGGELEPRFWMGTRVDLVDLGDRTAPAVVRSIEIEGELVGSRMIDGHVYSVLWSWMDIPNEAWQLLWQDDLGLPVLDWDATDEEREAAAVVAREILTPLVADIVIGLDLEELLPLLLDRSAAHPDSSPVPVVPCEELYLPASRASYSVLGVLHLDLGSEDLAAAPLDASGLFGEGWSVYASTHNLYVAESSTWGRWGWGGGGEMATAIHKFELDGSGERPVAYAATGEVPGWLLNQFSMSEHRGFLRVATTNFDWWWGVAGDSEDDGSMVTVLEDVGSGLLTQVGQVRGISPGEQIYATRFMGDRAYLVTFRQVDPLFTLDLSRPRHPRLVGELELPGYSGYLHPMDENHLIGVAMKGEWDGTVTGLAINLFDVSDFARPKLADQYVIEDRNNLWSWSEALSDHHAFTFHRGVLSIPAYVSNGWFTFSGMVVLSVDATDGIDALGWIDHGDLPGATWRPWMRRSAYIEDYIFSLSDRGLKVNELFDPDVEVAAVPFGP